MVLPGVAVDAAAVVPGGARPSYAHNYYASHNAFYTAWDAISRDHDTFRAWMERQVLHVADFAEHLSSLAGQEAGSR